MPKKDGKECNQTERILKQNRIIKKTTWADHADHG